MTFQTLKSEIERETETLFQIRFGKFVDGGFTRHDLKLIIREAMIIGSQLGIRQAHKITQDALASLANKDRN